MQHLMAKSLSKVNTVNLDFKRFLYERIDWNRRLIGITGARGTGKTTMLLQHIRLQHGLSDTALYVSLDDIYFADHRLTSLAHHFYLNGGQFLYLDEVHKYLSWSQEIKNIHDDLPDLKVVFTGSSILDIDKGEADLSRRAVLYDLPVMSLREYIAIRHHENFGPYPLTQILNNHVEISARINQVIKPVREFNDYNLRGAYPFFNESGSAYPLHLERIINLILETDLPAAVSIDYTSVVKLKQLLNIISESVPFKPNISKLSTKTGIMRDTLIRYLNHLERAGLITQLKTSTQGLSKMAKPEKIYLNNNNLMSALQEKSTDPGTLRETFFLSQLSPDHTLHYPAKGDFLVDHQYTFEVGGRNKTQRQITGLPQAWIAMDNIEFGTHNKIPLWLFGFLY